MRGSDSAEEFDRDFVRSQPAGHCRWVVIALSVMLCSLIATLWAVAMKSEHIGVLPGSERDSVESLQAKSSLWNALMTERAYYRAAGRFTSDSQVLENLNPDLKFAGFGKTSDVRAVAADGGFTVCLGVQTASGRRFFAREVAIGAPEARGRDTGAILAESDSSVDLTEGCSREAGAKWLESSIDWGTGPQAEPYLVCGYGDTRRGCSVDDRAKDWLIEVAGDAGAAYLHKGRFVTDSVPPDDLSYGPSRPVTPGSAVGDEGETLCLSAANEGDSTYYIKLVANSGGSGIAGTVYYFARAEFVPFELKSRCTRDSIAGWSIYPAVAGW